MAYAQRSDLNISDDRLVELTDNSATPNVADEDLLARLETQAETIVNAKLAGTIVVPFIGTIPPIITFVTASIWAYRIYRHRDVMEIPASIADDYKMAMDMLAQIVEGEIDLDPTVEASTGVPEIESSCPRGWTPRDLVN